MNNHYEAMRRAAHGLPSLCDACEHGWHGGCTQPTEDGDCCCEEKE